MDYIWNYLVKQALSLNGHDVTLIIATVVIMVTARTLKVTDHRLGVLEKHKVKTEAIIIALPFMTVGTGVWYTDDTRNGNYKPQFTCIYLQAKKEETDDRQQQNPRPT